MTIATAISKPGNTASAPRIFQRAPLSALLNALASKLPSAAVKDARCASHSPFGTKEERETQRAARASAQRKNAADRVAVRSKNGCERQAAGAQAAGASAGVVGRGSGATHSHVCTRTVKDDVCSQWVDWLGIELLSSCADGGGKRVVGER